MREKPIPPEDYECCQNDCSPCVWDGYYDDMDLWRAEQAELKSKAEQLAKDADSAE